MRERAAPWRTEESRRGASFPTYESIPLPKGQSHGQIVDLEGEDAMVPQQAVNHARRAELRVAKLRQGYKATQDKWAAFELKAKENFRRERTKFHKEQQRQGKELEEALAAQEDARVAIRRAMAADTVMAFPDESKGLPTVDEVFADWTREDDASFQQVLQRAMAPAHTPARGTGVPPMTPALRPPTDMEVTHAAAFPDDPYLGVAPSPPCGAMPAANAAPPGLSPVGTGQIPKTPSVGRKSIKETSKTAAVVEPLRGPDMQDKLDAKRRALHPFGVAPPGQADSSISHASPAARPGLLLDDDESLDVSPGFGNLDG